MAFREQLAGAWGGDPGRKWASIAAARAALAAGSPVACGPELWLAPPDHPDWSSSLYCAAYGTADPAELEIRSGMPTHVLRLISGTLAACECVNRQGGWTRGSRLVEVASAAPLSVLEAIPVGAEELALARCYVVELLIRLMELRGRDDRCLAPEQQALLGDLARLHTTGCDEPVAFRALRRAATAATDAATVDLETTALAFAESVAWPMSSLVAELPAIASRTHRDLRAHLSPERPTQDEVVALDTLTAMNLRVRDRLEADPGLDEEALYKQVAATPEYALVRSKEFQARMDHYDRVAAEAYAPFAVRLLLEAFRKA